MQLDATNDCTKCPKTAGSNPPQIDQTEPEVRWTPAELDRAYWDDPRSNPDHPFYNVVTHMPQGQQLQL